MKDELNIKYPTKAETKIIKGLHKKYNAKKVKEEKKCYLDCCNNRSINSHSFQKNGVLSSISDENKEVYSTYLPAVTFYEEPKDSYLFNVHINKASIFKGFCDEHDTRLFDPIEEGTTRNIEEYIFLNAFRGLAYTHFHEKEVRISNIEFSKEVIKNPRIHQETKDLYKKFAQNKHLTDDLYKYANMKEEMLSVFSNDYTVDLEMLKKKFDISYIELTGKQEFLGTAATAVLNEYSEHLVCLGFLPQFKAYPNIFFVVTFKRDRSIDELLRNICILNEQNLERELKVVIQNTLVFTSSNIVLSKNKYFKMKKYNQLDPLKNFHIRSISKEKIDLFCDYNVELFD